MPSLTLFLNACGGGSGDAGNSAQGGSRGFAGSGSSEEVEIDSATVIDTADKVAAMSDEDLNAAIAAADLDIEMALAQPSGLVRELGGNEMTARSQWVVVGMQMKLAADALASGALFGNTKPMSFIMKPGVRVQDDGGGGLSEAFGAGWLGGSLFNAFFVETVINDYSNGKSGASTNATGDGGITTTTGLSDTSINLNATAKFSLDGLSATIQTQSTIPCPDANGLVTVNSILDVTGQAGNAFQNARFTFELTAEVDDDAKLTGKNQLKTNTKAHTADSSKGYDTTDQSVDISITQFADEHFGDPNGNYKGTTQKDALGWMYMGLMSGESYRRQLLPNLQKMLDAGRCVSITVEPSDGPLNLMPFTNVDLLTKPRAKISNSGVTTHGTVQAKFKSNQGGAITESGDKVPADATFHYISPLDYGRKEIVTFEARSKRGTGKLDYTLTTSPHAD